MYFAKAFSLKTCLSKIYLVTVLSKASATLLKYDLNENPLSYLVLAEDVYRPLLLMCTELLENVYENVSKESLHLGQRISAVFATAVSLAPKHENYIKTLW
jgi:hypothetical protein